MLSREYWTVSRGPANRLFNCRECKGIIYKNTPMVCRDGRKLRFHYHEECFSGDADPRTQTNSSATGKFASVISPQAPATKGLGKWSTSYGYQPNLESLYKGARAGGGGDGAAGGSNSGASETSPGDKVKLTTAKSNAQIGSLTPKRGASTKASTEKGTPELRVAGIAAGSMPADGDG